jgi:hypothetical protein
VFSSNLGHLKWGGLFLPFASPLSLLYIVAAMSLPERTSPGLGIIEPCLPSPAKAPPSGPGWLHEIKHDGFRILARRDGARVRLITRHGNHFTSRFPFIATAVGKLPVRSCLIDGEAIVCDENGLAVFDLIRAKALASAPCFPRSICLSLTGRIYGASQSRRVKPCSRSSSTVRI